MINFSAPPSCDDITNTKFNNILHLCISLFLVNNRRTKNRSKQHYPHIQHDQNRTKCTKVNYLKQLNSSLRTFWVILFCVFVCKTLFGFRSLYNHLSPRLFCTIEWIQKANERQQCVLYAMLYGDWIILYTEMYMLNI